MIITPKDLTNCPSPLIKCDPNCPFNPENDVLCKECKFLEWKSKKAKMNEKYESEFLSIIGLPNQG